MHGLQVADMRITYTKGGLEESDFHQYGGDPMKAWADWFAKATEGKVGGRFSKGGAATNSLLLLLY
jgi:pyridoxine/pyridoxamine 5'-phosphate oxidase